MATNANIAPTVENGATVFIPLNKLKKHPKNARKTPHSEASIEAKAASIAAKGILQNLVVEPECNAAGEPTGFYLVSIGEGRRLAQMLRVKRKEIKKTEAIRCVIVITTDRRTYMIELRSGEKPYMPAVAWAYPQPAGGQRQAIPATPVIPAVAARNYRYSLTGSSNPPWKPLAVYDDGRRVYVEFPRGIVQGEMPPLFVIGPEGEAQIVNSRIYQHILIVDRLFGAAELRLGGGDRQQTVRIVRTDGRPQS